MVRSAEASVDPLPVSGVLPARDAMRTGGRPRFRASAAALATGEVGFLSALLVFFVIKQILLVYLIGPFLGHDEVDHFFYIQRLASGDGLGVVGNVELPAYAQPYQRFVADYPLNSEVIQPPLYHYALALLGRVSGLGTLASLYEFRLVSVVLGAMVVAVSWLIARQIFPEDRAIPAGCALFVALQPQFSFEAAIVNHDILLILLVTLVCYLVFGGMATGFGWRRSLALGLIGAAGMWTKVNFGLILPVIAVGLLLEAGFRWRASSRRLRPVLVRHLLVNGALAIALPLVAILPWFIRNLHLYGDPTGATRLQQVSDYGLSASTYREMIFSASHWRGLLDDFWGNFGWREIPLDHGLDITIYLVWLVAGLGAVALVLRQAAALLLRRPHWRVVNSYQTMCLGLSLLTIVLMVFGVLYVGTLQFTQARFAFPAMFAFGLFTVLGFMAWLPARWRWIVPPLLLVAMIVLNLDITLRFLIPYFVGPGGGALIEPAP